MHVIVALAVIVSAFFGLFSQPANAEAPASVEAPIVASSEASLPTYLPEVATSEAPTPAPAPQVEIPAIPAPEVGVRCEEDMPCWDCSTMGNGICGGETANPTTPICEEDQPCWDCATMGNKQCGLLASDADDAYASFDSQVGMPAITEEMKLSYVATVPVEPTVLEVGEFSIQDSNRADTWHIMRWDTLTTM